MDIASGPWTESHIREYLTSTVIPVRIASTGNVGPLVQSLWFAFDEEALWCCTQHDSVLAKRLSRDARLGFEVAADSPPYKGVRGRGLAELIPSAAATLLPRLIDRYLGDTNTPLADWLLSRIETETAIRISQIRVTTWDYTPRMA
jgi:hypothetical protein